ncbi:hypothetical protein BDU57DRAFT_514800 [Ampelomyces quisqualis]|uniref:Uncharacterized protein n=1 Tax=Ampelomyces quisqualis TaxID=50730 RepID=A0A6A5QTP8_AMPQU|nr:hypothetical protein BDU57DRAFT_514800 [Ampelomyces quisqualis]
MSIKDQASCDVALTCDQYTHPFQSPDDSEKATNSSCAGCHLFISASNRPPSARICANLVKGSSMPSTQHD